MWQKVCFCYISNLEPKKAPAAARMYNNNGVKQKKKSACGNTQGKYHIFCEKTITEIPFMSQKCNFELTKKRLRQHASTTTKVLNKKKGACGNTQAKHVTLFFGPKV
jgi:hypothetical protein